MAGTTEERCWLCARALGTRIEQHRPVPKSRGSRGSRQTVPIHPVCPRMLHKRFSNAELAMLGDSVAAIRADPRIGRFLKWISSKKRDFHAPTGKRR